MLPALDRLAEVADLTHQTALQADERQGYPEAAVPSHVVVLLSLGYGLWS